jgi:hypothetical protein
MQAVNDFVDSLLFFPCAGRRADLWLARASWHGSLPRLANRAFGQRTDLTAATALPLIGPKNGSRWAGGIDGG